MVVDEPPSDGDRTAAVGFLAEKSSDLLAGNATFLAWRARVWLVR
jgi:hypothetical protein